jgi:hypothetical protein
MLRRPTLSGMMPTAMMGLTRWSWPLGAAFGVRVLAADIAVPIGIPVPIGEAASKLGERARAVRADT